jgi:hypothetical protein
MALPLISRGNVIGAMGCFYGFATEGGAGGEKGGGGVAPVRGNFQDTAYWNATVTTGAGTTVSNVVSRVIFVRSSISISSTGFSRSFVRIASNAARARLPSGTVPP